MKPWGNKRPQKQILIQHETMGHFRFRWILRCTIYSSNPRAYGKNLFFMHTLEFILCTLKGFFFFLPGNGESVLFAHCKTCSTGMLWNFIGHFTVCDSFLVNIVQFSFVVYWFMSTAWIWFVVCFSWDARIILPFKKSTITYIFLSEPARVVKAQTVSLGIL